MATNLGVRIRGQCYTWEDAFQEAVHNPLRDWPYTADQLALLAGIDDDEPDDTAFSPSRLLGCYRAAVLKSGHGFYVDAESSWPLVRGRMVHALMERSRYPGVLDTIRERRFTTQIPTRYGPQPFTAKPDLIVVKGMDTVPFASKKEEREHRRHWWDERELKLFGLQQSYERDKDAEWGEFPDFDEWARPRIESWEAQHPEPVGRPVFRCSIVDYKSKSRIEHSLVEASLEHQLQVNMYALIVTRELPEVLGGEVVVDELEVDYVDMSRTRRFTSAGWLADRGKQTSRKYQQYETLHLAPIRHWSLEKVERFVVDRIEERLASAGAIPPMVREERRWLCNYCPVQALCYQIGEQGSQEAIA